MLVGMAFLDSMKSFYYLSGHFQTCSQEEVKYKDWLVGSSSPTEDFISKQSGAIENSGYFSCYTTVKAQVQMYLWSFSGVNVD